MQKNKIVMLAFLAILSSSAWAEENVKLGFGFDKGFGVTAQIDAINAFVGNDGLSADYIIKHGSFEESIFSWYVGGGAFVEWNGKGHGVRMPFGAGFPVGMGWHAYGQLAPELDFESSVDFHLTGAFGIRYAF